MNEDNTFFEENNTGSISDNQAVDNAPVVPSDGPDNLEDVTPDFDEDLESFENITVSGSDENAEENFDTDLQDYEGGFTVSGQNVYNITEVNIPVEPSFWHKPFADYTVTESVLIMLFIVVTIYIGWSVLRK